MKIPRVGQTWAFGDTSGRPIVIERIKRGVSGSWRFERGKFTHLSGRKSRIFITPSSGLSMTVQQFLKSFVFIK